MKKLFIPLIAILMVACGEQSNQNPNTFVISVPAEFANEVSISEVKGAQRGEKVNLSLVDGIFRYEGTTEIPAFYALQMDDKQAMLLVENGEVLNVSTNEANNSYQIEGNSKGSELVLDVNERMILFYQQVDSLQRKYQGLVQQASIEERKAIVAQFDSSATIILDECTNWLKGFIDENISSPATVMALYQQMSGVKFINIEKDLDYFEKVAESMNKLFPDAPFTSQLEAEINLSKSFAIGAPVPEFSLPNIDGENVSISSFKGKVTLIDFWASWCGPCRKESPNLVRAYRRFQPKGFEILSVSLDGTPRQRSPKESWLNAIEKDGLGAWVHVSDLKGWETSVRPLFNFNSIPYTVLIDAEGKIIAKNLRGAALEQKLEEVLAS